MKSHLSQSDILLFQGDALVIPCFSDVMHAGTYNSIMRKILDAAGPELVRELSALGDLELCHAYITHGYNLAVPHLIFYACYEDHADHALTSLDWHEIWKNVFTLARLYKLTKMGIKLPLNLAKPKGDLIFRIGNALHPRALEGDVLTILNTVFNTESSSDRPELSLFL